MTQDLTFGPVMLDVDGPTLTSHEKTLINHPNTGAIILFARNFQSPEQVQDLITEIRSARRGEILLAVDQEGGRVQRFQTGFTRLPPASAYAQNPGLAEAAGWLMAAELLSIGIDFSFAPVLDVDCGVSEIIGNRSFSQDPIEAAQLAGAFMAGMKTAGMAATGKHFPGHGAVALDSHLTLPVDERDLESIRAKDLVPFRRLIEQGLEAIMPAHVLYPKVDPNPAGFSAFWLQTLLRRELRFNGTIFSDDLSMAGAAFAGGFADRAKLAQQAGCDMILVCNNPEAAEAVLEALPVKADPQRQRRLEAMRGKTGTTRKALFATEKWQTISSQIQQLSENYA